jgi:hypothetical protein
MRATWHGIGGLKDNMSNVIYVVCFLAWLTAGSTIDRVFDDWHAAIIFVVTIIVTVVCAAVITGGDE